MEQWKFEKPVCILALTPEEMEILGDGLDALARTRPPIDHQAFSCLRDQCDVFKASREIGVDLTAFV